MKRLSQDSWPLSQNLNPGPPKFEAEVLPTQPHCLIECILGREEEMRLFYTVLN